MSYDNWKLAHPPEWDEPSEPEDDREWDDPNMGGVDRDDDTPDCNCGACTPPAYTCIRND
jgi:hypothetical protein